ncbi:MAG: hypothetical protein ACREA3_07225 [Nitrosotalea sp.]
MLEFESGDMMTFSHIVTLGDMNETKIKNNPNENSSSSIMIDVLLMLLCERTDNNQSLQDPISGTFNFSVEYTWDEEKSKKRQKEELDNYYETNKKYPKYNKQ